MKSYGQYCPIARTSELFAERWTPIIIRNLAAGCATFTELRAGAPGIPKALLAERLELLQRHGVVTRTVKPSGRGFTYALTESGHELKAVCDAMGEWGARWLEVQPHHLDPAYALWATSRLVDLSQVPAEGVVVRFDLDGEPVRRFWLVLDPTRAEVCTSYPGRHEDVLVTTDTDTLVRWALRHLSFEEARRAGRIRLEGRADLRRRFPTWIRPSPFAHIAPARRTETNRGA